MTMRTTPITSDMTFTYTYERVPVSYIVAFQDINGAWNNESTNDIVVTLTGD